MTKTSYFLAIDVGASRTAAAVARRSPDGSVTTAPAALGRHTDSAPSAVFVGDGDLLFGDAAVRRGVSQPERLVREFKRRVGDGTPIRAGNRRFTPEQLFALLVTWVIDTVAEREGERAAEISVSIPATWADHRSGLVSAALARDGWRDARLVSEPEAAALHYVAEGELAPDSLLGVYDLGGGTFDAALVRVGDDGAVELVGEPTGIDSFGGTDFDDAVMRHAVAAAALPIADLLDDETARVGLAALRREAVEAKEALSFDAETVIPVLLGDGRTTVRLTRSEFEAMIVDGIERTIDVFAELVESAGMQPADLTAILLTGGSSRIPRIAQLLSERFDRPVTVDADPKAVISLGAVRAIADAPRPLALPSTEADHDDVPVEEDAAPVFTRPETPRRWLGRAATVAAVAGGALVLSTGIAVAMLSPGAASTEEPEDAPAVTPAAEPTTPTSPAPEPTASTTAPTVSTTVPPSSTPATSVPLLTPAPPGVVTDIFPPDGAGTPVPQLTAD